MDKKTRKLLRAIAIFLLAYLGLTLINWSFNTTTWGDGSSIVLLFIGIILILDNL